jgi:chromosome partitioning protein
MKDEYDVVLFDCPPNFSTVTRNAIIASDYYLVPAKMDYLSTIGIDQLIDRVRKFVSEFNEFATTKDKVAPSFLGVVASMVSYYGKNLINAQQYYYNQLQLKGIRIFDSKIRVNNSLYTYAAEQSRPVITTDNGEVGSELNNLTDEFIRRAGL